ncbi:hypothetical protein KCP76_23700 [Salmonella enterica subsp. enterica serovar Weltevreden]|nr:hypothetical protein KCP76_23700 [Salmonella enterica subsp. enterica serovar Weltevreden]
MLFPACLNDRQNSACGIRLAPRSLIGIAFGLGLFKLRCSDYFMLPGIGNCFYSGLARMRSGSCYGWLGQRDGKLLPPPSDAANCIADGTAILNREAHDVRFYMRY